MPYKQTLPRQARLQSKVGLCSLLSLPLYFSLHRSTMEGVGARLGRSSTRYGPATVFTGPVRKWKKTWVPLSNPNSNNTTTNSNSTNNNRSHLLLYKWTPENGNGAANPEEPQKRKYRYIPVSVLEEQKQEAAVKTEEESKPNDADPSSTPTEPSNGKKDDVLMEEVQVSSMAKDPDKDGNGTELNLNLGLKDPDGDADGDLNMGKQGEGSGQLDKVGSFENVEMNNLTNSETENRLKRKANTPDLEMRM